MKTKQFFTKLTAVTALLASTTLLNAEPILYASAGGGSTLVRIDVGTGKVSEIGPLGQPFALAIAISPQGRLFTVTDSYPDFPGTPRLAHVDLLTGAAAPFGPSLGAEEFMAIAFSPEGTLYGVNADSGSLDQNSLYQFDLTTGEATKVGVTDGCGDVMDLAFHPDGTLYGAAWDSLYRINRHTGRAELVRKFQGLNWIMGLAIDDKGNFYVTEIVPNAPLWRVNPDTGTATAVPNVTLDSPHGLEFIPTPRSTPISIAFQKSPVDADTWLGSVDTDLDGAYSDGSLLYEQISKTVTGKTVQFTGSYTVETSFYSFTALLNLKLNLNDGSVRGNGTVAEGWLQGTQVHLEADLVPGGVAGVMRLMPGSAN